MQRWETWVVARRDTAGRAAGRHAPALAGVRRAPPQHARHEPTPHPRFARRAARARPAAARPDCAMGPYHAFADQRGWLGIPHAADVLSNLFFALIGAWALGKARRATMPRSPGAPSRWRCWPPRPAGALPLGPGQCLARLRPPADRLGLRGAAVRLRRAARCALRFRRRQRLAVALLAASASVLLWWLSEAAAAATCAPTCSCSSCPCCWCPRRC